MPQSNPFPNPLTGKMSQPAGPSRQGKPVLRPGSPLNTPRTVKKFVGPDASREFRREMYFIDKPDPLADNRTPEQIEHARFLAERKKKQDLNARIQAEGGQGGVPMPDYFSPGNPNPEIDLFSGRQKSDYDALMAGAQKNEAQRKAGFFTGRRPGDALDARGNILASK